jgi:hypothetical protein
LRHRKIVWWISREIGGAGIREQDIEPSLLLSDLRKQAIEIREIGYVALHPGGIASDLFDRRR